MGNADKNVDAGDGRNGNAGPSGGTGADTGTRTGTSINSPTPTGINSHTPTGINSPTATQTHPHTHPNTTDNGTEAYVTLVTSDAYVIGACVLAQSLAETGTTRGVWCVAGSSGPGSALSAPMVAVLRRVFGGRVVEVGAVDSGDAQGLALLGRPELGATLTKLQVWALTRFRKIVFLDADTLVLRNIDELFAQGELSAAPDAGWPDCFNSGVFVAEPSAATHRALLARCVAEGSFDGADQGLLNAHFPTWTRLSFLYNVTVNAAYSYAPAYARHGHGAKVVHFVGRVKPWAWTRAPDGSLRAPGEAPPGVQALVARWWAVRDRLERGCGGLGEGCLGVGGAEGAGGAGTGTGTSPYTSPHPCTHPLAHSSCTAPAPNMELAQYRVKWSADVERYFRARPALHQQRACEATGPLPFARKQPELSRNHQSVPVTVVSPTSPAGRLCLLPLRDSEDDLDQRYYED